ncbi:MAG: M48 family metallopeptidase, partial [Alphaproteobacteria bacterium]|nr:M48 family metallopeptidase [Alphaproteobacteria bacterium]
FRLRKEKKSLDTPEEIGGVRVRPNARARRFSLRVDARLGDVVLTWPRGGSERHALRFIAENKDWIAGRRDTMTPPKNFAEGDIVPVYGRGVTIARRDGRGVTVLEGDRLVVHGRPEYLARRVKDFLKNTAQDVLEDIAAQKQDKLGLKPKPVTIRDPKARWGSCGPDGRMMFSWRLILAPPVVLDYVVAHEVAHRIHLNHSRKFWALCAELAEDAVAGKKWLRKNGHAVMAYR